MIYIVIIVFIKVVFSQKAYLELRSYTTSLFNINPKIRKELSITHPTNFKSVITLSNPQSP